MSSMHKHVRNPRLYLVRVHRHLILVLDNHLLIPLFGHLVQLPLIRLESLGNPIFECQFTSFRTNYISITPSQAKNEKERTG